MPRRPSPLLVTLLTDFGLRDHFVGVMKGVIATLAPRARVVDIIHELPPFQVAPARFALAQSWPYFPERTVHIVVVDPGVGGPRRPILVAAGGHFFVGPDNGVFSDLLALPGAKVRHITNARLFLPAVSTTFHGRDVFAPVAASLAAGLAPARVGPLIQDALCLPPSGAVRISEATWTGRVVSVDRFGNLITDLAIAALPDLSRRRFVLTLAGTSLTSLSPSYSAGTPGEPILLADSSGCLEIAVNQGSAAARLGAGLGAPVQLVLD